MIMEFIFSDLISKYEVPCKLITFTQGSYIAGEYTKGVKLSRDIKAAIITMTSRAIYESGGRLTSSDRQMFIAKDKDIINLENGAFYVEHNGNSFKVEESYLYGEDYADFNSYTLRRVSSFDV